MTDKHDSSHPSPPPAKGVDASRPAAAHPAPAHGGMIVREAEPLNLEMPFGALDHFVTGTDEFFVRCHYSIPTVDRARWRLRINGDVRRPLELSWEDVRGMPAATVTATLECAGNGRVFLSPQVDGAQWERGAVGNAEWTGVRLSEVLERAGLTPAAREVVLTGADSGKTAKSPAPGGKVHFARSVPVAKALDDVLLAWEMNGETLTPPHGFPLRAIVPGWYGMASVKWLAEVTVTAQPFHGYFQSVDYAYWRRDLGEPSLVAITELQVKAQIARPGPAEAVSAGRAYLVRGAAWSSEAEIVRVELSVDGGRHWNDACLGDRTDRHAWRLWEYEWQVPSTAGKATLMARATDSLGRTQPVERDPDRGGYMINEVMPMEVVIREPPLA
jgi:DMSO/TMAO reductase YedYZ molybdopterin-dependent catalytic subunit